MRTALGAMICCFFLLGCRADKPRQSILNFTNPTQTREELLKVIPIGTSLSEADKVMSENGFRPVKDPSKWRTPEPGIAPTPGGTINEGASYVTYWIDVRTDKMVARSWYVQLYHKAGAIEDIKITSGGLTGP